MTKTKKRDVINIKKLKIKKKLKKKRENFEWQKLLQEWLSKCYLSALGFDLSLIYLKFNINFMG